MLLGFFVRSEVYGHCCDCQQSGGVPAGMKIKETSDGSCPYAIVPLNCKGTVTYPLMDQNGNKITPTASLNCPNCQHPIWDHQCVAGAAGSETCGYAVQAPTGTTCTIAKPVPANC